MFVHWLSRLNSRLNVHLRLGQFKHNFPAFVFRGLFPPFKRNGSFPLFLFVSEVSLVLVLMPAFVCFALCATFSRHVSIMELSRSFCEHNISITSGNTRDGSISRNVRRTNPLICLMLFSLAHKHKHKKNKVNVFVSLVLMLMLMRK